MIGLILNVVGLFAAYLLMMEYSQGFEATSWIYWAAAGAGALLVVSAVYEGAKALLDVLGRTLAKLDQ